MIFKTAALLVISLALPASATWPPSPATQAGESKKYKVFYGEPGKHPLGTVLCDEGEKATIRWNSVEHRATHTIVDGGGGPSTSRLKMANPYPFGLLEGRQGNTSLRQTKYPEPSRIEAISGRQSKFPTQTMVWVSPFRSKHSSRL